jgi:hypothetical protein
LSDDRYVKILLTSVAGVLMAGIALAMILLTGEALLGVVRGAARILVLLVPVALIVAALVGTAISITRKRIWDRDEAARAREGASDDQLSSPVAVAREYAPDALPDVERALESITMLRRLPPLDIPVVAEALALADRRIPELLSRHSAAITGAKPGERQEISRHMLEGIVIIGQACEEARVTAVGALGNDVETQKRYLASRTGYDTLGK